MQARLPNFIDLLLDAVFVVDEQGRVAFVSAACERILGYTPQELLGQSLLDLILPEDRARTVAEMARVSSGEARIGFENRYRHRDGRTVHLTWSARWVEGERLRIGVARDVTELKRAEALQAAVYAVSEAAQNASGLDGLLPELHRIVAALVPVAAMAVATCDEAGGALDFVYRQGWQAGEGAGFPVGREHCLRAMRDAQPLLLEGDAPGAGCALLMPLATRNGPVGLAVLRSPAGLGYEEKARELLAFVAGQVAIAIERARLKADLLQAAMYDELTRLPNRRLLYDRCRQALARCRRHQARLALLYVDVDDFKQVNDSFGHASGDLLLREFAGRLAGAVRASDTVARLAGDEFVVLMEDVGGESDAAAVVLKIREALAPAVLVEGGSVHISASIGIALYPEHGDDVEPLLRHADRAMYGAKKAG
ncbi:diguanylate cyclase [Azoarcus indigens]|uniref:Diguanylate cyclase with PAS/PAC and GAF sensors n=1 Tax=Azoarcus indigens TaxID=29545 RepID=A0A4R6DMD3_9RHOO|nr:GGDEF domain-containing protein [Azoarcus indigens]NMG66113.1 diguanylate cyclase [Azoarcus indigens]TDN46041.1 diguanylate cyclase with PAS/PAC and GAF sensors [Azoarcus indigens]